MFIRIDTKKNIKKLSRNSPISLKEFNDIIVSEFKPYLDEVPDDEVVQLLLEIKTRNDLLLNKNSFEPKIREFCQGILKGDLYFFISYQNHSCIVTGSELTPDIINDIINKNRSLIKLDIVF